jgi:hypothetical protein
MHLLPTVGYGRASVSHDEWVAFASDENNPQLVADFAECLEGGRPSSLSSLSPTGSDASASRPAHMAKADTAASKASSDDAIAAGVSGNLHSRSARYSRLAFSVLVVTGPVKTRG